MTQGKLLSFFVEGLPGAQGSKRHVGGGVMIEQNKKVEPWRQDVRTAARDAAQGMSFGGPTHITIHFVMPHLKSDKFRTRHVGRGDLDKLVRSTLDALESVGVLVNDSLVCSLHTTKTCAREGQPSGARIQIIDLDGAEASDRAQLKADAAAARAKTVA